ncbi:hypothetical protein AB1Y20_010267 [Prymnesium parvum]|uniref:Zinc transporter ZIP11 n=1 Tax=Prymnesium parvum TaxID=97485 RepID=A0AB34K3W9_PRYPA
MAPLCLLLLASLPQLSANGRVSPRGPTPPALRHCSVLDHAAARLRGGACLTEPPRLASEPPLSERMRTWHPVLLGLLGTCFGWFMTALGAATVVVHHLGLPDAVYRRVLDFMLGVSGGVMTAASYWSLLAPALEFAAAQGWGDRVWLPVALGFLSGGLLLQASEKLLEAMHGSLEELDLYKGVAAGGGAAADPATRKQQFRRLMLLIIAITIHNFPEGMAVGVAFGAIRGSPGATLGRAITLAVGIGIQNFPEGMAVSMPLMREGVSPLSSFWYGQLSGMVEPIGGVLGAAFVHYCRPMLPFTMSLAAGAMIYVVCDSLVPEMQAHGNKALAMQGLMFGFVIMMVLDVALG